MSQAKLVIKNTFFLYIKMILSIGISLYSVRLVLKSLGSEDYGVFNLVSGIIAMLSFLNVAMTVSTQRYLSVYLGAKDFDKLKQVFHISFILHLIIGFTVVCVLELIGVWLFDGFLNIPSDRIEAAKLVYHFMVVSVFFTINAVPYDALINAHENMFLDALLGIFESLMRLCIAISLIYYSSDRLILYSVLLTILIIVIRLIKSGYCYLKYQECKLMLKIKIDKKLFNEMFSFARWNFFGALSGMTRNQGIAIILNLFHGPIANAAYGIANQVSGQLSSFSNMMLKAINPQIMKSEGGNDRERMLKLAMTSSKFSFFLLSIFAIPTIFEMTSILEFWLKKVPKHTVVFCDLVLVATLTKQLSIGLQSAFQATGKIKRYQTIVGLLLLLNLPIAYILLKYELPIYSVLVSFIVVEFLAFVFRLSLFERITGLKMTDFIKKVIGYEIIPVSVSVLTCYFVVSYFNFQYRFLLTGIISAIVFVTTIYISGLDKQEKGVITSVFKKYMIKK